MQKAYQIFNFFYGFENHILYFITKNLKEKFNKTSFFLDNFI